MIKALREAADSPNLLTDISTMLTATRLFVWFTILNGGLCFFVFIGLLLSLEERGLGNMVARIGFGQFSSILIFWTLGLFITFFVPLRTSGLFFWPRMHRYFDQIVLSSISPFRYWLGKVMGVNLFFALLLLASIPYLIFSVSLGGMRIVFIVECILALFLYTNLLCLVTLAGATVSNEVMNTAGITVIFALAYFAPMHPDAYLTGAITPLRIILSPLYEASAPGENHLLWPLLMFATYPIAIAMAGIFLLLGPIHCIGLPNSTFGEVTMPGDSKRKAIFRRHGQLRRRSELSFFYENRSPWASRFEIPLRWGNLLFAMLLTYVGALAALHYFADDFDTSQMSAGALVISVALVVIATAFLSNDRGSEKTLVNWGHQQANAGTVDTFCFVGFLTLVMVATPLTLLVRQWFGFDWSGNDWVITQSPLTFLLMWIIGLGAYSFYRARSMRSWGRSSAAAFLILFVLLIWLLPMLPIAIVDSFRHTRLEHKIPRAVYDTCAFLAYISPWPFLTLQHDSAELPHGVETFKHSGAVFTFVFHTVITLWTISMGFKAHRSTDPWEAKV